MKRREHELQGGVLQVGAPQIGLVEVAARQVAVLQVRPGQDRHPQITVLHVHIFQSCHAEINSYDQWQHV